MGSMDKKEIINFVHYNYIPLTRKNVTDNILLVWIFTGIGILIKWLDQHVLIIALPILSLLFTVYSIYIYKKHKNEIDKGLILSLLYSLLLSILLLSGAIMFLSMLTGKRQYMVLLLCIVAICLYQAVVLIVLRRNIARNNYSKSNRQIGGIFVVATIGGLLGLVFARSFLTNLNQSTALYFLFYLCFILSVLFSTGVCVNSYKLFLFKRLSS